VSDRAPQTTPRWHPTRAATAVSVVPSDSGAAAQLLPNSSCTPFVVSNEAGLNPGLMVSVCTIMVCPFNVLSSGIVNGIEFDEPVGVNVTEMSGSV